MRSTAVSQLSSEERGAWWCSASLLPVEVGPPLYTVWLFVLIFCTKGLSVMACVNGIICHRSLRDLCACVCTATLKEGKKDIKILQHQGTVGVFTLP